MLLLHSYIRACTPAFGLVGIRMVITGIRLQTCSQVIVNRFIGKIIARDLSLLVSWLYRMAGTQTWVTCHRYIIPLFRRRPPGLHKPYRRKRKGKGHTEWNNHPTYAIVQTHTSHNWSVQLNGDLLADPVLRETPPPLAGGKHPSWRHLCRAVIQRRKAENRETRKYPKVIPSPYVNFLTHAPTTIIPVARITRRRSLLQF